MTEDGLPRAVEIRLQDLKSTVLFYWRERLTAKQTDGRSGGRSTKLRTTDTVDYEIVPDGEAWLELNDGHRFHLKPNDVTVQNGSATRRATKPFKMARIILIGGTHRSQQVPRVAVAVGCETGREDPQ